MVERYAHTRRGRENRREFMRSPRGQWSRYINQGRGRSSMRPEDKRKQMRGMWENVVQWEEDIGTNRERRISTARLRMARSGLEFGSDLWNEQIRGIEQESERELEEIQAGPTMEALQEYWGGEEAKAFNTGAWAEARKAAIEEMGDAPQAPDDFMRRGRYDYDLQRRTKERTESYYSGLQQRHQELFKEYSRDRKRMREFFRNKFS